MKVYAKQISPEYQEAYMFYRDKQGKLNFEDEVYNENITIRGNRDYADHTTAIFDRVFSALESGELADIMDDFKTGGYYTSFYKNITEAINDYLYREDKKPYSTKVIHELKQLVNKYSSCKRNEEDSIICRVLSIVTGENYTCKDIKGSSQGDWQTVYYPTGKISDKEIEYIEACYFNTGSEWIVHDEEAEPESPEDINGYSVYCIGWNDELIKLEIAEAAECKPEEVVMYAFKDYARIPIYEAV